MQQTVLGLAYLVGQKFHVRRGKPESQEAALLLFSLWPGCRSWKIRFLPQHWQVVQRFCQEERQARKRRSYSLADAVCFIWNPEWKILCLRVVLKTM